MAANRKCARSRFPMLRTLLIAACCAPLLLSPVCAEEAGPSAERDLPPEAERAIANGIEFLVRTQNPDGSWLSDGSTGRYSVAMTALAGLALLAHGSTPHSGPHAANVRSAVAYLLRQADPESGLISGQEPGRPMFGHGFAMLFLAQVHGSEGQTALGRRVRAALEGAVELTARAQSRLGGWFYTPGSADDEGAVTITQMQGLRACANAGIGVPPDTVEAALGYIRASANPDGGIAYRASEPGESRSGITCAAVATLYAGGIYEGELVEGALRYARANTPLAAPSASGGTHFSYSHLYLSQAMYFRGGQEWQDYFSGIRTWLVQVQQPDGSWLGDFIGRTYGTAVALLVLQLPYNNLPILQR
jgi:hypothetical protein